MTAIISRSIVIVLMLLVGLIVFSAKPSIAETLLLPFTEQKDDAVGSAGKTTAAQDVAEPATAAKTAAGGPVSTYIATAYSLRGRTASGRMVSRGLIAADPRVLPLGSRVRLDHPGYSGEYLVADTGGMIRGRRIDIWTPTSREAMRFGRRPVKLTVLSYGGRRAKQSKR